MTVKHPAWERGFEPDGCFFLGEKAAAVEGSDELDPVRDPAPDVVLEVDISRSSIRKDAVLAQFGVAEVWRHDGQRMAVRVLPDDRYRPSPVSRALPPLSGDDLTRLLALRAETTSTRWLREVRAWARDASTR